VLGFAFGKHKETTQFIVMFATRLLAPAAWFSYQRDSIHEQRKRTTAN
jgi:hypothetical protein